jgi:excisionase family DNA binding protein
MKTTPASIPPERPMRLAAAAEYLGVGLKTVQRLIVEGKLIAFKIRGQWFTKLSFVEAYIESQLLKAQGRSVSC